MRDPVHSEKRKTSLMNLIENQQDIFEKQSVILRKFCFPSTHLVKYVLMLTIFVVVVVQMHGRKGQKRTNSPCPSGQSPTVQ